MTNNNIQNFYKKLIKNINGISSGGNHYYLVRVFYEDTDSGGIVYHSNYLKYFERARTSLLNLMNINQKTLFDEEGLSFVVRKVSMKITTPFYLNDIIIIETRLKYAKNSSITIQQLAYRYCDMTKSKELLVSGIIQIVAMSSSFKVRRINKVLKNSFFQNNLQ